MTAAVVRSGRLGGRKTTTGCKTCKRRKIKCDEAKPSCTRCMKAGRQCEGYEFWVAAAAHDLPKWLQPRPPAQKTLSLPYTNQEEYLCFRFFVEDYGHWIGGALDKDFWVRLLPQLCHINHAVRYGMFALSCLYRDLRARMTSANGEAPKCELPILDFPIETSSSAVEWYSKAIKKTLANLENSPGAGQTALITCILFFCIESIQRHDSAAISLFLQGQSLIGGDKDHESKTTTQSLFLSDELRAIFVRLRLHAALLNVYAPPKHVLLDEEPDSTTLTPFDDIDQARTALHALTAEAHNFAVYASQYVRSGDVDPTHASLLELQCLNYQSQLHTWSVRAASFLSLTHPSLHSPPTPRERVASHVIQTHHLLMTITLSCALSRTEVSYDAHLTSFATVVELVEQIIALKTCASAPPTVFTFEVALIPALFITAFRCREPRLRRRAAGMLRLTPRQEGLWEADLVRKVAERVIDLEEAGSEGFAAEGQVSWPNEDQRLHEVVVGIRTAAPNGREGCMVTFSRVLDGPDGPVNKWEEWVDC